MLARANRLLTANEFRLTTRRGAKRVSAECLSYCIQTAQESPVRFGFVISKSVGNAVVRNRIRRRMRAAAFEIVRDGTTGSDVVLRAQPAAVDVSVLVWEQRLREALGIS